MILSFSLLVFKCLLHVFIIKIKQIMPCMSCKLKMQIKVCSCITLTLYNVLGFSNLNISLYRFFTSIKAETLLKSLWVIADCLSLCQRRRCMMMLLCVVAIYIYHVIKMQFIMEMMLYLHETSFKSVNWLYKVLVEPQKVM